MRLPFIAMLCGFATIASAEVTARLEILVPRTLPGLRVPMKLTIENRGTADVLLGDTVVYSVRESDGTTYLAARQPAVPPHQPLEGMLSRMTEKKASS